MHGKAAEATLTQRLKQTFQSLFVLRKLTKLPFLPGCLPSVHKLPRGDVEHDSGSHPAANGGSKGSC